MFQVLAPELQIILLLSDDLAQGLLLSSVPQPFLETPGAEDKRGRRFSPSSHRRIPTGRAPRSLRISRHFPPVNQLGASPGTFSDAARRPASPQGFQLRRGATRPGRGRGHHAPPTAPAWVSKGLRDRCLAEIRCLSISSPLKEGCLKCSRPGTTAKDLEGVLITPRLGERGFCSYLSATRSDCLLNPIPPSSPIHRLVRPSLRAPRLDGRGQPLDVTTLRSPGGVKGSPLANARPSSPSSQAEILTLAVPRAPTVAQRAKCLLAHFRNAAQLKKKEEEGVYFAFCSCWGALAERADLGLQPRPPRRLQGPGTPTATGRVVPGVGAQAAAPRAPALTLPLASNSMM